MPQLPEQSVIPHDKVPEDLPADVPDHVSNDASVGYEKVKFSQMRVEDAYDDMWVITYRWGHDELSRREAEDLFKMVKENHADYEDARMVKADTEWVIRLDYTP